MIPKGYKYVSKEDVNKAASKETPEVVKDPDIEARVAESKMLLLEALPLLKASRKSRRVPIEVYWTTTSGSLYAPVTNKHDIGVLRAWHISDLHRHVGDNRGVFSERGGVGFTVNGRIVRVDEYEERLGNTVGKIRVPSRTIKEVKARGAIGQFMLGDKVKNRELIIEEDLGVRVEDFEFQYSTSGSADNNLSQQEVENPTNLQSAMLHPDFIQEKLKQILS